MPDQYGPYRKFRYNLESLKQRMEDAQKKNVVGRQGFKDAVKDARAKALEEAYLIMNK